MTPRSLCIVSNLYGDRARGGAERIAEDEATALARRGARVTVVTAAPDGDAVFERGGVDVREVHPSNLSFYTDLHGRSWAFRLAWHVLDIFNARAASRVLGELRAASPDVVHTHNLMGLGFMVPSAIRRYGDATWVHTVHDVQLLHPSGLLPPRFFRARWPHQRLYVALMRRMMGSPDTVIFPSERHRDLHAGHGFFPGSRHVVLRNPAPEAASSPRETPRRPRFAFIGQLEAHKGVGTLLDAWEAWTGRGDAALAIAGGGSLADEVADRARRLPGVEFLGRVDRRRVLETLEVSSHVVVPSEVLENAPTVLLEALSRGTPAIAANTGGIGELVIEGETGALFPPGDVGGLVAAFDRAARLDGWEEMSAACLARAREMSLEKHVEALEVVYEEAKRSQVVKF